MAKKKTERSEQQDINFEDVMKDWGAENQSFARVASNLNPPTVLPTGIDSLDYYLLGGIPEGCINFLVGWESSGKSWAALNIAREAQKKYPDKKVIYGSFEGSFDPDWAELIGVDLSRLIVFEPPVIEEGLDVLIASLRAKDVCLVIIDSVAGMITAKQEESSLGDLHIAPLARLMANTFPKMTKTLAYEYNTNKHNITVLVINQFRHKAGFVLGDPKTLVGGNSQKYFMTTRLDLAMKKTIQKIDGREIEALGELTVQIIKKRQQSLGKVCCASVSLSSLTGTTAGQLIDRGKTIIDIGRLENVITGRKPVKVEGLDESFESTDALIERLNNDPALARAIIVKSIKKARILLDLNETPMDGYLA